MNNGASNEATKLAEGEDLEILKHLLKVTTNAYMTWKMMEEEVCKA